MPKYFSCCSITYDFYLSMLYCQISCFVLIFSKKLNMHQITNFQIRYNCALCIVNYMLLKCQYSVQGFLKIILRFFIKKRGTAIVPLFYRCGNVLCSRPVTRQVFSAMKSLTSVFGMWTGGPLLHNHHNGKVLRTNA